MSYNMTAQQVFDKVATHLFKQAKRSMDTENDTCMYRSEDGLMCAVGALIPDDDYNTHMEFLGVHSLSLSKHVSNELKQFLCRYESLLAKLQMVHDCGDSADGCFTSEDNMRKRLTKVAHEFNLSPAILTDLHFPEKSV